MFAVAMLIRPLVLVLLLAFVVKPLARFIMSFVTSSRLRRVLLLRLGEPIRRKASR